MPIKLEEVEEKDTETYLLPARKLSVEEAKLAAERLAKDKNWLQLLTRKSSASRVFFSGLCKWIGREIPTLQGFLG